MTLLFSASQNNEFRSLGVFVFVCNFFDLVCGPKREYG